MNLDNYTDIILNIMTIISFVVSGILGISKLLQSRKKLDIEIKDYKNIFNVIQLYMFITNNSTNPISISSISLNSNGKSIQCELLPKKIRGKGNDLISTPTFPLNVNPQESRNYFLEFLDCSDILLNEGTLLSLTIYTNRGMIKKDITLPHKSHYLHIGHQ